VPKDATLSSPELVPTHFLDQRYAPASYHKKAIDAKRLKLR